MTPFESCLAALRQPGPSEGLFKALDKALADTVGHRLFTLLYVAPDGKRTRLGGKKLMAPTGAAVDSTGAVYVSNFSVLPRRTPKKSPFKGAGGQLVRITP